MDMQDLLDEAPTEDDLLMTQRNWPTSAAVALLALAASLLVLLACFIGAALASHGSSDTIEASNYTSSTIQRASAVTPHAPKNTHSSGLEYYDPCGRQGIASEIPCDTPTEPNHGLTGWATSSKVLWPLSVLGVLALAALCFTMLSARLDHNRQYRDNIKPSA